MKIINTFVDTSTVNRILELDTRQVKNAVYEEDRIYLSKIIKDYVDKGFIQLIVNPSVKLEIENTSDYQKKEQLLALFNQFHFIPYNKTIFPFIFPATFVTEEEKRELGKLSEKIRGFRKDQKILLDAVSNSQAEVLLTTDRKHLARKEICNYLKSKDLDKKLEVFTPKEFFEYLQKKDFGS